MNALAQSHGTKGTERARTWSCLGPGHHRPRRGGEGTQRAEKGAGETPALRLVHPGRGEGGKVPAAAALRATSRPRGYRATTVSGGGRVLVASQRSTLRDAE